jgi:hypothetical protein
MDLREYRLSDEQIKAGAKLVASGNFRYQPYIISDRLEVGHGWLLHDRRRGGESFFDGDYFADPEMGIELGKPVSDLETFRLRNSEYRGLYDLAADKIVEFMGGSIDGKSVAEIGANAGLHLYNLRRRGAGRCVGYEKNDVGPIYRWLNDITGLGVELQSGFWLSLEHRYVPEDLPEFDIMVSSHVLNHMSDTLHHLAYICDRAREGIFIWTSVQQGDELFRVQYPLGTAFAGDPFPLNLNVGIGYSETGLRASLAALGFDEVHHIPVAPPSPGWAGFLERFQMYFARRTRPDKSALDPAYRQALDNAIRDHLAQIAAREP